MHRAARQLPLALLLLAVPLGLLAGCTDRPTGGDYRRVLPTPEPGCVDPDRDGHGDGCTAGPDCTEADPSQWDGCGRCADPALGCACEPGTAPEACYLEPSRDNDGAAMCHEGTRYCRAGSWSACEGIQSYALSPATAALIDPDAGPVQCNLCNPICFRITDNLDPLDGGLGDANTDDRIAWADGGGLTLATDPSSGAAPAEPDAGAPDCMLGTAPDRDCDGLEDTFDPYPDDPPFATANPVIFLDIPPGQTGVGQIDLSFYLNSADVYFLVDQSGSMDGERDQLVADLTTGDFIQDADYPCSDYDFDGSPNNELKTGGIVGAIRCFIRDSNFGVGLFREIPFNRSGGGYANSDQVVFDNHQDITGSVSDVQTAVNALQTIGNKEWPEASALALHNLVTGSGMYFGVEKPGIPPRNDCGDGRWGYPCFRSGAIPIVILFTDAMMHNGPSDNAYAYNDYYLDMNVGTDAEYVPVGTSIESFGSAYAVGDVTDSLLTFTGNTETMAADVPASMLSCLGVDGGKDAVFEFSLSQSRTVQLETTGSRFDTVLSLFDSAPVSETVLDPSDNNNEATGTAADLGAVDDSYLTITGNTSAMAADYDGSTAGCGAAGDAPDAVYRFSLAADATVNIDTADSAFDTVLTLYDSVPPAAPSYSAQLNTNNTLQTAHDLGDLYNGSAAVSGDTSAGLMSAVYAADEVGCGADDAASDAAYAFSLSGNTRVRISTEGSSTDTVLALISDACAGNPAGCNYGTTGSGTVPGSAETAGTAYDIGALDGAAFTLTGDTTSMSADFSDGDIGCGVHSNGRDAVVEFSLAATTDVELSTEGSAFDTVVALMGAPALTTENSASSGTNESTGSAQDLGALDGKSFVVSGSTIGRSADHTSSEIGCAPGSDDAADVAFKFTLAAPTRVRLDTLGSSFDTVLSLHDGPITAPGGQTSIAMDQSSEHPGNAYVLPGNMDGNDHQLSGTTTGMDPNFNFPTWDDDSPDTLVRFTVGTAGTYEIDTEGSSFDTYLCVYPVPAGSGSVPDFAVTPGSTPATALDIGDGQAWRHSFSGTTSTDGFDASACSGVASSAPDHIYSFTLTDSERMAFSTYWSSLDTALSLYEWDDAGHTSYSFVDCHVDKNGLFYRNSSALTENLGAGDYFIVVTGEHSYDSGNYYLTVTPNSLGSDNALECDDDDGTGTLSYISRSYTAGDYYAVLKGYGSGDHGNYVLNLTDPAAAGGAGDNNQVDCNDDSAGSLSEIDSVVDLPAGDYYVVLTGSTQFDQGLFQLTITDEGYVPVPGTLDCDDDSGTGSTSLLTYDDLPAGDYYVVVKGDGSGDRGAFDLSVRDASVTAMPVDECDDDDGEGSTSVIERDLTAGSYSILVKGDGAGDEGAYRLSIRDVTNVSDGRLTCDDDGGSGSTSSITEALTAGTYYVGVKGDGAAEGGAYSLTVRDDAVGGSDVACDDDGSSYLTSAISTTLSPGTYYAVVKGYDGDDDGDFQFTVGGASESTTKYVPPVWSETLAALQATETRVMTVLSCQDDPSYGDASGECNTTRDQAIDLANGTDALGASLQPLVFDIDSDGSGLSSTVVDGISSLTEYLEMDVEVQILFFPDANPVATPFLVSIDAVSQPGDDCEGVIGNVFQNCKPGATPRFLVNFENPTDNPVAFNPDDPLGGYNFRAQLIGDGQFLIDEVPIYIIPDDVVPDEEELGVYTEGNYWQDIFAAGCDSGANERPDWDELTWTGSAPTGSTITFGACGGSTAAALESCTSYDIAQITGVGSCSDDSDCSYGYCDTDVGACQVATAGACVEDEDCPTNATCAVGRCTFSAQPVRIREALAGPDGSGSGNLQPHLRLSINMTVDDAFDAPPVLYEWGLTYLCTTTE